MPVILAESEAHLISAPTVKKSPLFDLKGPTIDSFLAIKTPQAILAIWGEASARFRSAQHGLRLGLLRGQLKILTQKSETVIVLQHYFKLRAMPHTEVGIIKLSNRKVKIQIFSGQAFLTTHNSRRKLKARQELVLVKKQRAAPRSLPQYARFRVDLKNGSKLVSYDIRVNKEELQLISVYQKPRTFKMSEVAAIYSINQM